MMYVRGWSSTQRDHRLKQRECSAGLLAGYLQRVSIAQQPYRLSLARWHMDGSFFLRWHTVCPPWPHSSSDSRPPPYYETSTLSTDTGHHIDSLQGLRHQFRRLSWRSSENHSYEHFGEYDEGVPKPPVTPTLLSHAHPRAPTGSLLRRPPCAGTLLCGSAQHRAHRSRNCTV